MRQLAMVLTVNEQCAATSLEEETELLVLPYMLTKSAQVSAHCPAAR